TFTDYEVILIDDESPDNTGIIMDQYAEKYDNFHVIHKTNEGISVARNIGIKESRGRYIAFVDSDDLLSPSAYQQLVGTIEKTNSDIAVGGVKRFNSKKNVYSFLHRKAILDGMNQTSILKHPELVYDTTVWNKVFKKSLLTDNDILFPEGVIYEDIPFTLEAHLNAKSIDIVDHIVYYWRWREGENLSWTQQRNDLELYYQRLASIKNGLEIINKRHAVQLINPFLKKAYEVDIPLFIPDPKFGDLSYAVEFQKLSYRFIKEIGEEYIDFVRPDKQVRLRALMNGDIDTMIGYVAHNTRGQKIIYQDDHLRFVNDYIKDRPWLDQVRLEESVPFNSKILSVKKVGPLCYNLKGVSYARYTQNIQHDDNNYTVELQKVEGNDKEKIPLTFEEEKTSFVKGFLGKKTTVGLSIKIDFEKIADQLTEGTWKIHVTDEVSELKSWGFLGNPKKKVKKIPSFVLGDHLITAKYNNNWELSFIIQKVENQVTASTLKENHVLIEGDFSLQADTAILEL
ncbi:MAG: glycosyltransferase, partial [Pisciglobus halotolerans]|nr:glycosyltransferase [Pisciglobus halotolerans]